MGRYEKFFNVVGNKRKIKMKEQIQELIAQHKTYKEEVFNLLQELSLYDYDKLDMYEAEALETRRSFLSEELNLRSSFISDLEGLISV